MTDSNNQRVLILSSSETDANSSAMSIARNGYAVLVCGNVTELCAEVKRGVGALFLTKEVLSDEALQQLTRALDKQPTWSHVPIILILSSGDIARTSDSSLQRLEPLGNVTLLERPLRVGALVTTVRAAIAYRRRQYETRDLLAELEKSRQEAVRANRAKSDFLANMSHEIRTPLGAVLGFSELLMESVLSERERHVYMTAIKRNGQLLSALIDDILDLAKVESGRIEIENIEFSLTELMSEIVSSLEPRASKKGLTLSVQRVPGAPETVRTDPIRLKQILVNIVGNAIKFTSHGSVAIRIDAEVGDKGHHRLKFEVEDTGLGISVSQAGHLFQPFTQADTSTTRRFGGTGLGLVLARKLARTMGGDLVLKWSIPGGGSCFGIELLVDVVAEERADHGRATDGASGGRLPLGGTKILVVDDSLDNQLLIGRILKLLGAEVELANDGIEGVEKALNKPYSVVLMDLQMPRLGGVEATRLLREKGYSQPIVALTAHALKEDRLRCLSVGCTDYLTKPIERAHLVEVLSRVTEEGRRATLPS